MRLPTLHQLDSLVQLAAHDRPEIREQALELCRMMPAAVRMLASARLIDRNAFHAAALCAWPDDASAAADLMRAVVRDCGEHVHARWLEETRADPALRAALEAGKPGGSPRAIRRRLEKAVSAHPSRPVYAMAIIGMAQLESDPAAGLSACRDHFPQASARPAGARPWIAARMRRHLAAQRPLTDDDRYRLIAAFAAALDADDFERAGILLSGGCAHVLREETRHGPEAILRFYQESSRQARERFDAIAYTSSVHAVEADAVVLACADHLVLGEQQHTFRSQQRLWLDDLGRIWRIEHRDLPGQRAGMRRFEDAALGGA